MLFERLLVYEDRAPVSAAMNMAIDEALLESCTCPVLRFYGWRGPSLSFGYFGKFANIGPEIKDRDLVRRWTGGGSVLHDRDLTYSLITPASDPASGEGPTAIYATLHGAIRQALREDGRETELATAVGPNRLELGVVPLFPRRWSPRSAGPHNNLQLRRFLTKLRRTKPGGCKAGPKRRMSSTPLW